MKRLRMTQLALSALALATVALVAPADGAASVVPYHRMAACDLAPAGYAHHPVLRIDQDFHPNDAYEIAIDAWTADDEPESMAGVRMWWLDTSDANARSPFGKGVRRHIDIDYQDRGAGGWDIGIKQGRKRYTFEVRREDGGVVAYSDVQADGTLIEDCKIQRSRLVAKKVLGISTGLKRIDVTCTDAEGKEHRGSVARL